MKLTGLILLVSLLVACQPKPQGPSSYFCRPELEEFFAGPDSLPVIEFKHTDSFEVIEKQLIEKTDWEKESVVMYRIPVNYNSYKSYLRVVKTNFNNGIICFSKNNIITIVLDSSDKYLIENKTGSDSTISNIVRDAVLNHGRDVDLPSDPSKTSVWLHYDKKSSEKSFYGALKSIVDGYIMAVDNRSFHRYGKSICEVNSTQADSVLINIPLYIQLNHLGMYPYPEFQEDFN